MTSWAGLAVVKGTPDSVVNLWNDETNKLLSDDTVREQITKFDYDPRGGSSVDFSKLIASDIAQYKKLASDMHISAD